MLDSEGISNALTALAEQLAAVPEQPIEIAVCGGAALRVLRLVDRTTRDVDVLAIACRDSVGELTLIPADPFPLALAEAVAVVARDMGLTKDWLNPGPTGLLTEGLPVGLIGRLCPKRYGSGLVVHFVGRFDQICLKLYAVVNGGAARHLEDLGTLKPSDDEMEEAARWCLTQDASEQFPMIVISCLEKIGYPNVARRVETGV